MSTHLIKLEEAGKTYLPRRFSLSIEEDDFMIISGTNGSGKTTLLMLILGFIHPDMGCISKQKFQMGYVPEKVILPPLVKVEEYLKTIARIKGGIIDYHLIHRLKIPCQKYLFELSKGNQQKVAIYSAFLGNPHLIILDEPLSGIDEEMKDIIIDLIEEKHNEGIPMLISTHEPTSFIHLATKHIKL